MTGLLDVQAAIASSGLPSLAALPDAIPDAGDWADLIGWAREERLIGMLAHAIAEGPLEVTLEQAKAVAHHHTEAMAWVLTLERILLGLAGRLEAQSIPHVVLKGPTVAHTVYPDPSMRCYGDIDLLVPGRDVDRTVALLEADGCRRPYPEIRPGFDRRFGKSVTLIRPDGVEVDLHRTLVAGRFGLSVGLDSLFRAARPLEIGGRRVPMLAPEERLLVACYNAALGDAVPRVMTLRDIAQMLLQSELDEGRVLSLAEAWGAQAVLARAIRLSWAALRLTSTTGLSEWSATYRPSRADQRALASYTTSRSATAQTLSALRMVPRVQDKVALITAVVVPNRGYLDRRGPDPKRYVNWWRRGIRSLARAVSRR
jgi:hypothetical protein